MLNIWEGSALSVISSLADNKFLLIFSIAPLYACPVYWPGNGDFSVLSWLFHSGLFRKVNFTLVGEAYEIIWYFPDKIYASPRVMCKVPDQNLFWGILVISHYQPLHLIL